MAKNRFEEISQFLHLNDTSREPAREEANFDRLYKCHPALTAVLRNVQRCYLPTKNISVDEGMIAFKGRLSFRQYLPAKPTKYGIKVWMAADSSNGYVVNFSVYLGSEGEIQRRHRLGYDVVMHIVRPFFNRNHHVFFDNFFSSPVLLDHLLAQQTYACSTVRCTRKELLQCAKNKLREPGQMITQQRGNLLFVKWHDKRDVAFLSTCFARRAFSDRAAQEEWKKHRHSKTRCLGCLHSKHGWCKIVLISFDLITLLEDSCESGTNTSFGSSSMLLLAMDMFWNANTEEETVSENDHKPLFGWS